MNKLGIPSKGVNFCSRCYEFHDHSVVVSEEGALVEVTLTCLDCGNKQTHWDDKNTFFEYENESAANEQI